MTLARAVLVLLLLALPRRRRHRRARLDARRVGAVAAALDGVDGALARGRGEASEFGARFDMETDALLILVLAALVWQHGKAGVWILLAGLLRYLFVAASYACPWLGAALPPSRRRQAVCVVQIVSLIGALAPLVAPPSSAALALAGLAVARLVVRRRRRLARAARAFLRHTMNDTRPLDARHWLEIGRRRCSS